MFENKFMTVAIAVAVGALSQAITFGTYDYFKGQGYSGWKAGAFSGGLIAGVSGLLLPMLVKGAQEAAAPTAGCMSGNCGGLAGITLTAIPKAVGYLTAQQLNGITVQQLSGQPGLKIVA